MSIIVKDTSKEYNLTIEHDGEKVVITISPLTYKQKSRIASLTTTFKDGEVLGDQGLSAFYVVKFSVKKVKGIMDDEGKPYKLSFDGDELSDKCVEDLMGASFNNQLLFAAANLMGGLPDVFVNPATGLPLEGVSLKKVGGKAAVKK